MNSPTTTTGRKHARACLCKAHRSHLFALHVVSRARLFRAIAGKVAAAALDAGEPRRGDLRHHGTTHGRGGLHVTLSRVKARCRRSALACRCAVRSRMRAWRAGGLPASCQRKKEKSRVPWQGGGMRVPPLLVCLAAACAAAALLARAGPRGAQVTSLAAFPACAIPPCPQGKD